jgi:general secretion pathway protein D
MKIIRNILLVLISTLMLFACKENPLLLNEDVFSLEKNRAPAKQKDITTTSQGDVLTSEHVTKNAKGISLFESDQVTPYRDNKKLAMESIAISENKETDNKTKKQQTSGIKSSAQQLNTNGSVPRITTVNKDQQPQVVDETGIIQNADEIVQLDYEQIEVRQILEELADALGMSIVIDPSISGKITMRTSPNQPLKNKDLWAVLNMLMNESGISLEKKAGLYYAKKSPLYLPADVGYPSLIKDSNASVALQITPLKNISVDAALAVLKPIIGPKSKISQIAQLNMLAIIGSKEQLSRINGLLELIDADPFKHRGIRLYKIKQTEAKKLATELEDILKLIEGDKSSYQVLALERINALLVVAPPKRGFKPVDRWVKILDEGADEGLQEQIFIYHCKSVECETLASTLNSIFDQSNTTKEKKTKVQTTNQANVFRTVPKDSLNVKSKAKPKSTTTAVKPKVATGKNNKDANSADINVTIVSDSDTNTLIVRTTGKDYRNLLETIKRLDQTPLQVLVNVVIAQVSLAKSQSLGLDWQFKDGRSVLQNNLGKASEAVDNNPFGLIVSGTSGNFAASLNALASDGDVNILSRPSLLIANNKEGSINIGKEVPVQTSETNNINNNNTTTDTSQVTQSIAYRNTGIELKVTPHINEDGVVNMEITQSLSSIEGSTSSQDASFKPTFSNQDLTTTVVVGDGETIILGGLIDSATSYEDTGIPILKDIPIAGYLFKTQQESEDRRELMLIITPRIIGPDTDLNLFGKEFSKRFKAVAHYMDKELSNNKNTIMEKNK